MTSRPIIPPSSLMNKFAYLEAALMKDVFINSIDERILRCQIRVYM